MSDTVTVPRWRPIDMTTDAERAEHYMKAQLAANDLTAKVMRENAKLLAALRKIDAFVNDRHRPLGDKRFSQIAAMTRAALK